MSKTLQAAVVVLAGIAMFAPQAMAGDTELVLNGSTTVGPIADAFVGPFKKANPGVNITVSKTGSGNGVAALIDGRCDIAMASRFMKDKEFKAAVEKGIMPVAHVIALDAVCVIVNPANPVKELTTDQIRAIYKGEITNWSQLGGPNAEIRPITRDSSSGTYETFHKLVMNKESMGKVEEVSSNATAKKRVQTTRGAIAYVGLGFVDESVRALKVNGIMPNRKTVQTGEYPVARPLYLFTNGYPKLGSIVYKFVTFYLTDQGQDIVDVNGFIPLTNY